MSIDKWIRDTGERVISTFIAAVVTWLAAMDRLEVGWVEALAAAAVPPVIVVLMQAVPGLVYTGPVWWIDALVRVVRSFLQGFLGALAASATVLDLAVWESASVAGGMAALAVVKALIARSKPGTITPASLARAGS